MYSPFGSIRPYAPASEAPFLFVDDGESATTATDGRAQLQLIHLVDVAGEEVASSEAPDC